MSHYREQIAGAIRATVIHSPTNYSWFGKKSPAFPKRLVEAITSKSARTLLLNDLQNQLYTDFYCKGEASAASKDEAPLAEVETLDFVADLAAACGVRGYCEDNGWRVRDAAPCICGRANKTA